MRIFISYASVDEALARALHLTLEEVGISSFLDKKDVAWGDDVLERVARGLADSTVVVIISPASLKSQWVPFEVGQAMALGKTVLPFLTHPSIDAPDFLRKLNYKTKVEDVREYFSARLEATKRASLSRTSGKMSAKERDATRAARNELLRNRMRGEPGVTSATVLQIDDHTDNGYVLFLEFEDSATSAGKVVARVREVLAELFPDVPIWGEMKVEEDTSAGFAFTYLDQWNKRARTG